MCDFPLDTHKTVSIIIGMDTQTSAPAHDWHPADIKAALEKRGLSLRALAKQYEYSHIQRVLQGPWWAAEQIVARAIGVPAQKIWPSRYLSTRERGRNMTRNQAALSLVTTKARAVKVVPAAAKRRKAA